MLGAAAGPGYCSRVVACCVCRRLSGRTSDGGFEPVTAPVAAAPLLGAPRPALTGALFPSCLLACTVWCRCATTGRSWASPRGRAWRWRPGRNPPPCCGCRATAAGGPPSRSASATTSSRWDATLGGKGTYVRRDRSCARRLRTIGQGKRIGVVAHNVRCPVTTSRGPDHRGGRHRAVSCCQQWYPACNERWGCACSSPDGCARGM